MNNKKQDLQKTILEYTTVLYALNALLTTLINLINLINAAP
jgi:hypothetical protein